MNKSYTQSKNTKIFLRAKLKFKANTYVFKKRAFREKALLILSWIICILFLNNDPAGMNAKVAFNNHQVDAFGFS